MLTSNETWCLHGDIYMQSKQTFQLVMNGEIQLNFVKLQSLYLDKHFLTYKVICIQDVI